MTALETAGWLVLWYALGAAGAYVCTYLARPLLRLIARPLSPPVTDWLIRVFAVAAGAVVGWQGFGAVGGLVVGAFGGATSAWAVARFKPVVAAWAKTFGGQVGRDE